MITQTLQQVIFIKKIGADLELVTLMQAHFMECKSMGRTGVLNMMAGWGSIWGLHGRWDCIDQATKWIASLWTAVHLGLI